MEPTARTCSEVYEDGRCCPLDRISQLPDPILHLILCKLLGKRTGRYTVDTRYVVQMTITLSKRWKNLWASLPCLLFSEERNYNGYRDMVLLVNAVLLLRDSLDIHKFYLHWQPGSWIHVEHHLNTWAEYVVRHNVKRLTLKVDLQRHHGRYDPMEFPPCIFTCPSLEKLRLEVYFGFSLHTIETVRLSRLRKLYLYQLHSVRDSLGKLTFGCPVLEDLKMKDCDIHNPKISSDTLKSLSISESGLTGTTIQISCPNLQSLDFYENETDGSKVEPENLSSLVQACIQIRDGCGNRYPYGNEEPLNFISSTSKASELSAFCNLKKLALLGYLNDDYFEAVTYFLERSPNLEFLEITTEDTYFFMEEQETCTRLFVCPHYKITITFNCGVENERVIKLVKEFLDIKCDCSKLDEIVCSNDHFIRHPRFRITTTTSWIRKSAL